MIQSEDITNRLFDMQSTKDLSQTSVGPTTAKKLPSHKAKINALAFNGNSKFQTQLVSVDSAGMMNIHDVSSNICQTSIKASQTWLTAVDVDRVEGRRIAVGTLDYKILIYEMNVTNKASKGKTFQQNKPIVEMQGHSGTILCLQFLSPNYVIAGSGDQMVSIWDLENPSHYISIHQAHTGQVLCMNSFNNDPNIFLSGSSDLTCQIWDIRIQDPVQSTFRGHQSALNSVQFAPFTEPTTFATASDDSTIKMYDLRFKDPIATFQDQTSCDGIHSICFSQSGRLIFGAAETHKLKIWDTLGPGSQVHKYLDVGFTDGMIKSMDLSSDGWTLALSGTKPEDLVYVN